MATSSNPAEIPCAVHLRPGMAFTIRPLSKGKMSVTMVVAFLVKTNRCKDTGLATKNLEVVPHTVGIVDSILKKGTNNILSMRDRKILMKEALIFRESLETGCPSLEFKAYMEESNAVVKQTMVGIHPLASVTAPITEPCFDRNTLTWKEFTDPDIQISVFCPLRIR